MSLTIRISLLLLMVLLMALFGDLATDVVESRETLTEREQLQTRLAASELAYRLSVLGADALAADDAVRATLAERHLRSVRVRYADGRPELLRESRSHAVSAPLWFSALLPIEAGAGQADLSAVGGAYGKVETVAEPTLASNALWQSTLHAARVLGLIGLAVSGIAAAGIWFLRREMARISNQAIAVHEGKLAAMPAPSIREMKPMARGLNLLAQRLRVARRAQTRQLESLRRQAHYDPLTDLPNRRQFIHHLDQALAGDSRAAESGLLLIRVLELQDMNTRIGRLAADQVLLAVAQTLKTYVGHVEGCFAGRLNGSDFGLYLPVGGVAVETARTLVQSLRAPIAAVDPEAAIVTGAAELPGPCNAKTALATADSALLNTGGWWQADTVSTPTSALAAGEGLPARGAEEWRRLVAEALSDRRVRLGEFPVHDQSGKLVYLDCPLHIQIDLGGEFEIAQRWMSVVQRGRLTARVDTLAIELALERIRSDGVARCVNIATASALSADFVAAVSSRLAQFAMHGKLWLDLPESLAVSHPALVKDIVSRWHALGASMALEHCGEDLGRIAQLPELGIECVRIDGRFIRGIATDADARGYVQGLAALAHGAGIAISAEAVASADDLAVVWSLAFDAASGPAVR
jgi:EAL domain-containing protein (putative c-di-GMP-specific phosphodiesterase class I)/GGDEF domain-containing protein